MIPTEKQAGVARALRTAFGVEEFEDIRPLTAGLSSALVFRIVVKGQPYLLRVMVSKATAPGPGQGDPTRQFKCMESGAQAGIAPWVWYTNVEDRISITDFVEAKPFPRSEALIKLAATLRTLHALPPFPAAVNYRAMMDGFVQRFQSAKILPEHETAEMFEQFARMASVYANDPADLVSCHNDLKPENILFDGERVWLVDWEAAFLNDGYTDLSVVANFVVTDDAEQEVFLQTYFGEPANKYQRARFFLMGQRVHMFYAAVFLLLGSGGQPVETNASAPDFRRFHDGIWNGEISLVTPEAKVQYGSVHVNQLLQNMRVPRFEETLRVISKT